MSQSVTTQTVTGTPKTELVSVDTARGVAYFNVIRPITFSIIRTNYITITSLYNILETVVTAVRRSFIITGPINTVWVDVVPTSYVKGRQTVFAGVSSPGAGGGGGGLPSGGGVGARPGTRVAM